jgi:oligo-1,6-glucosidase
MAWWHSAVAYQIYPRSFADGNGDGVGDLKGIITHLDYLAMLGVDVVWLSPIYRSPMDDNGYDISDYDDIDPLFGTLDDFDALVDGLHARGMRLVMDMVINHTSDEHPWFVESRDPASPKRDWYYWRPAREGFVPGTPGAEPTNWGSFFSGRGWAFDEASGEYYLHLFSAKQPDLNWENPEVRVALYAMMRRWLDRGVDGFRFDVINLISKTLPLADGPAGPDGICYDPSLVVEGPRLHEFLKELNSEVGISERELFSVGEMVLVNSADARSHTDPDAGELGMVFTFEHMGVDAGPSGLKWDIAPLQLPALKANLALWQDALADVGWNSLYWENHDQPRSVSRFGDDSPQFRVASAKTLATTLHLLKGTPFIYQGQELGMTNAGFTSIEQYDDIESRNFYAGGLAMGLEPGQLLTSLALRSRDNARTPMCWHAGTHAGFTSGTPWLPVNANHDQINAADALADSDSVLHHYRKLIGLRYDLEVVRQGRFELLLAEHPTLFCYLRTLDDQVLLVVGNWSSVPVPLPVDELPSLAGSRVILGTHPEVGDLLAGWESRVYLLG